MTACTVQRLTQGDKMARKTAQTVTAQTAAAPQVLDSDGGTTVPDIDTGVGSDTPVIVDDGSTTTTSPVPATGDPYPAPSESEPVKAPREHVNAVFHSKDEAKTSAEERTAGLKPRKDGKAPVGYKVYTVKATQDIQAGAEAFIVARSPAVASGEAALAFGLDTERDHKSKVLDPETYLSLLDDEKMTELEQRIQERKQMHGINA